MKTYKIKFKKMIIAAKNKQDAILEASFRIALKSEDYIDSMEIIAETNEKELGGLIFEK